MDIISTKGVAEVLGVSEATVKRWADAGTLRCFRTPGGHRKFRLRDVKSFLSGQQDGGGDGAIVPAAPTTDLSTEQREARTLVLAGDVDALVSLVAHQRLQGIPLARTFDQIFAPVMFDIGEGWSQGRISAAQEHIASNALLDTLARIRPLLERSARTDKGRALCACLGDEHHDLGVRTVALVLAADGYRTTMLGGNVPAGDLALMLAGDPPSLLALSASPHASAERLRGELAILSSAANTTRTRIIVGGQGFQKVNPLPSHIQRYATLEELVGVAGPSSSTRASAAAGAPAL